MCALLPLLGALAFLLSAAAYALTAPRGEP